MPAVPGAARPAGPTSGPPTASCPAPLWPTRSTPETLRALFVLGGNPLTTLPDSDRLRRSFAALDVLAVCDIRSTETTAVATHVLPVAGQLERADLTSFLDLYFPFPFAQYSPAAVAAPPGRPPMWRIFAGLGRRLGLPGFADLEARDRRHDPGRRRPPLPRCPGQTLAAAPSGVAPTGTPGARLADPEAAPPRHPRPRPAGAGGPVRGLAGGTGRRRRWCSSTGGSSARPTRCCATAHGRRRCSMHPDDCRPAGAGRRSDRPHRLGRTARPTAARRGDRRRSGPASCRSPTAGAPPASTA